MEQDPRLEALERKWRERYDEKLPAKLTLLDQLLSQFKVQFDQEVLRSFRIEIHKIAGGAGTVGYNEASEIAKAFDQDLQNKLEHFPPDPSCIVEFEQSLKRLKSSFSK